MSLLAGSCAVFKAENLTRDWIYFNRWPGKLFLTVASAVAFSCIITVDSADTVSTFLSIPGPSSGWLSFLERLGEQVTPNSWQVFPVAGFAWSPNRLVNCRTSRGSLRRKDHPCPKGFRIKKNVCSPSALESIQRRDSARGVRYELPLLLSKLAIMSQLVV